MWELCGNFSTSKMPLTGVRGIVCGARKPTPRSIVYVNYTGRLIDGTVFDTTEDQPLPALFMVGDLIMGWQIALTRMHEGDRWEVYIPAKWGYGATKMVHTQNSVDMQSINLCGNSIFTIFII